MGKEVANSKKSLPSWDDTISDLSVHKLSAEELARKRQSFQSNNHVKSIQQLKEKRRAESKLSEFIQNLDHQLNAFAFDRKEHILANKQDTPKFNDHPSHRGASGVRTQSPQRPSVPDPPEAPTMEQKRHFPAARPYVDHTKVLQLYNVAHAASHENQGKTPFSAEKENVGANFTKIPTRALSYHPPKVVDIENEIEHFEKKLQKNQHPQRKPPKQYKLDTQSPVATNAVSDITKKLQLQIAKLDNLASDSLPIQQDLFISLKDLVVSLVEYSSDTGKDFTPILSLAIKTTECYSIEHEYFNRERAQKTEALEATNNRILELEQSLAKSASTNAHQQQIITQYNNTKEFEYIGNKINQLRSMANSPTSPSKIPSQLQADSTPIARLNHQPQITPSIPMMQPEPISSPIPPNHGPNIHTPYTKQSYNAYSKALLERQQTFLKTPFAPHSMHRQWVSDQQTPDISNGSVYGVKIIEGRMGK